MSLDCTFQTIAKRVYSQPNPHVVRIGTICAFGGAMDGHDPVLHHQVEELGTLIGRAAIRLIYGGGDCGLMGRIAKAAADAGSEVIAIAPRCLAETFMPPVGLAHAIVVPDMSVRKRMMVDYADAIVALPGGIGTLDQVSEVITLAKLAQHAKPLLLANFGGFWSPLLALMTHMQTSGFIKGSASDCIVVERVQDILPTLRRAISQKPI